MTQVKNPKDFRHRITTDIRKTLKSNPDVQQIWNDLTKLARSEWICWITTVKKEETRKAHLKRMCENLRAGKRRPCCWPGCPHRKANAAKWFN